MERHINITLAQGSIAAVELKRGGLYHFCSSNGLVVVANYKMVTDEGQAYIHGTILLLCLSKVMLRKLMRLGICSSMGLLHLMPSETVSQEAWRPMSWTNKDSPTGLGCPANIDIEYL